MGIDAARQHEHAAGIDLMAAARQALPERDDPAVADADVGGHGVASGGDEAVANDGIEVVHEGSFCGGDQRPASLRSMCAVSRAAKAATAIRAQTMAR